MPRYAAEAPWMTPRVRRALRRGPRTPVVVRRPDHRASEAAGPGPDDGAPARVLREWHEMTPGELIAEWAGLRAWVAWLHGRYEPPVEERLPSCWALHPGLVEELHALRQWREEIYSCGEPGQGQAARYWHAELRALIQAATTVYAAGCRTGHRGAAGLAGIRRDLLDEWGGGYPLAGIPEVDIAAGQARGTGEWASTGAMAAALDDGDAVPVPGSDLLVKDGGTWAPAAGGWVQVPGAGLAPPRLPDLAASEDGGPMDALTSRAEHAVLGAMVASPALCDRLRRCVKPAEFEDEWHRHVYETIVSVSRGRPLVPDGWREAVLQADPSLTHDDLNALVSGCPDPGHGIVYGTMVVTCWARRHLADSGRAMAARSRELSREASLISRADAPGGREAAMVADHAGQVAKAIRAHAAAIEPRAVLPGQGDPGPGQAGREELVLAALLRQWPEQAREILQILRPEAFRDEYRREVFRVLSAMHQATRPVDELTLDWELAAHGLSLRSQGGGETYGQRLARLRTGYEEAVFAAREIQDQHELGGRPRAAGLGQAAKPRRLQGLPGTPRQARGAGETPRPVLRLIQEPGPDRGPQAR